MRVIAGKAKGRKLQAPPGLHTRPVTDRIKEALFSIWQSYLYDANFLDLFSGSGSMGIEAMSRGAAYTVMVDQSKAAVSSIRENVKHCGLLEVPHHIYEQNIFHVLPLLERQGKKFDIIYVDPPFTVDELFEKSMEALADGRLLQPEGLVAIRTRTGRPLAEQFGCLQKFRLKTYGESQVHFYEVAEREENSEGVLL